MWVIQLSVVQFNRSRAANCRGKRLMKLAQAECTKLTKELSQQMQISPQIKQRPVVHAAVIIMLPHTLCPPLEHGNRNVLVVVVGVVHAAVIRHKLLATEHQSFIIHRALVDNTVCPACEEENALQFLVVEEIVE